MRQLPILCLALCSCFTAQQDAGVESPETWTLHTEHRIPLSRDDSLSPGDAWDLAVDSRHNIYALLTRLQQVRVFDSGGRLIRLLGRQGSGPGEFRAPIKLAIGPGDSVWISDDIAGRWLVFDPAGVYMRQVPRRSARSCRPGCGWFDSDGRLVDGALEAAAPSVFDNIILWPSDSGKAPDRTILPTRRDRAPSNRLSPFKPFEPRGLFAFDPRGFLWFAFSDVYRIARLSPNGDTIQIIERNVAPLPVTSEDRAAVEKALPSFTRQTGVPGSVAWPQFKPVIAQLVIADDGALWIALVGPRDGEVQRFEVVDTLGQVANVRVDAPISINPVGAPGTDPRPLVVKDSRLYSVTEDQDGNQFIVVASIRRPTRSNPIKRESVNGPDEC